MDYGITNLKQVFRHPWQKPGRYIPAGLLPFINSFLHLFKSNKKVTSQIKRTLPVFLYSFNRQYNPAPITTVPITDVIITGVAGTIKAMPPIIMIALLSNILPHLNILTKNAFSRIFIYKIPSQCFCYAKSNSGINSTSKTWYYFG